jgi:radical SAM superfamily enzyme YgiQ (UPF0313 family)
VELGLETISQAGQTILDKRQDVEAAIRVVDSLVESGIHVVLNLIFGLPGECDEDVIRQVQWFHEQEARFGNRISASANLLEIERGSPLSAHPLVRTTAIAPWAQSYLWNEPALSRDAVDLIASING